MRGCTELWEAVPDRAHWRDLAKLKVGDKVEFVDQWDMFDEGFIVPEGTKCTVVRNALAGVWEPQLVLRAIAGQEVGLGLEETWNGLIYLYPFLAELARDFPEADEFNPSPVRII